MADEKDDVLEEGAEGIVAAEPQENHDEAEDESIAALARDMGWTPKEEFKGDPERFKGARDYILASRDIQRETSRTAAARGEELASLRQTMETVQRTTAAIVERQLAEERAKLTARYEQAVEDGDAATARRLGSELDTIDVRAKEVTQPTGPDPVVKAWVEKNPWFNTDPLAYARAKEVAQAYADRGESPTVQLAKAEETVRREYPHLFGEQRKPATVEKPAGRAPHTPSREKGFNDLPAEAKAIARDMEERGLIKKEDYAREYWANSEGKAR